jgi:hypothetical protein
MIPLFDLMRSIGSGRCLINFAGFIKCCCHAKSVEWTICVILPGIYNVSNGITVIWLFGQFRWSSCNKLALFSDLPDIHLLGALLEPSLPSRVEKEETLNTPLWGGLADTNRRPFPHYLNLLARWNCAPGQEELLGALQPCNMKYGDILVDAWWMQL